LKKIIKNIPNAITSLNLLSGCMSVVMAFRGNIEVATYFIFAAAIFDFFDGFAARALKAYSPLGKQLDSLADVVSFGVAPSAIMFNMLFVIQTNIAFCANPNAIFAVSFVSFFIAVFSAIRLAKFNIDERQTESFIGLNTPACALFICGLVHFNLYSFIGCIVLLAAIPVLCFLLVCELPMFSLKIKKTESFLKKYYLQVLLLACSLVFIVVWHFKGITMSIALYVVLSVFSSVKKQKA